MGKTGAADYRDKFYHHFDYSPMAVRLPAEHQSCNTYCYSDWSRYSIGGRRFLIYADNQPHMTKMGANSLAVQGQPYMFDMPGGGSARICTKRDTYPDGREFVGGVKPDIEVRSTLNDYLQKKILCWTKHWNT